MCARVLLIEDDLSIADFLGRGLREEGYEVTHVADGDQGQQKLQAESWDVVLLDCWLPKSDGLTVLRRYRQQGGEAPVLLLTARDAIADRVAGLDSGADDYLCKPFAFQELLARIRSLSRRSDYRPRSLLTYADVTIDIVAQRVERDKKKLDLTAKEFLLLTFFLKYPEKVLTRDLIYESVWNEPYDGISNTLEVHIKDLRRKLEAHGPRLIHTIRGSGYVLSSNAVAEMVQS
jgi:two-component system copper resistance phosphate regulon response regulator CusR